MTATAFEYFELFDLTPDLVCIASRAGYFLKINQAVSARLEYTEEELFAQPISSFIHPEDRDRTGTTRTEMLNGKALLNFQNRYLTKSGGIVWLQWTSVYVPDKEVVFAIAKDVTDQKRAEEIREEAHRKFKSLAAHFKTSIEKDKKFLATTLHEELAQLAAVARIDIDWLHSNLTDLSSDTSDRIAHALSVTDILINALRRLSYSISPNMVEDLGLQETLQWICKEFADNHGITCTFSSNYKLDNLSSEVQLDLFRICQESLQNVARHAMASAVAVIIKLEGEELCLSIADNGKGFDTRQVSLGNGLTNMRERSISINGNFSVTSHPGKGTTVSFMLPEPMPVLK